MKAKSIGLLSLLGALVLLGCSEAVKLTAPMPAAELAAYQSCTQNGDCVYVTNGCCDCANGGEDAAINRSLLSAFQSRFDCGAAMCTLMAAIPPCGSGAVGCQQGKCTYARILPAK